jgi:hypothetical protein
MQLEILQASLEAFTFLTVLSATALALWPEPAVEPEPEPEPEWSKSFDDFDTQEQCEDFYAPQ